MYKFLICRKNNKLVLIDIYLPLPFYYKKKTNTRKTYTTATQLPPCQHHQAVVNPSAMNPALLNPPPFHPLNHKQLTKLLKWLPLPLDPNHPAWRNRCFDCFQIGYTPGACKGNMVCLKCLHSGHSARDCPRHRRTAFSVMTQLDHKELEVTPPYPTSDQRQSMCSCMKCLS